MRPIGALAVMLFCFAGTAVAQQANDYGRDESWLCRPGRHDACDVDLSTTVVDDDGRFTVEPWQADPAAPIDCFYVYPTVSTDPGPNSDLAADAAELNVVRQQFARFGSKCRLYAPLYRQITLAGLRPMLAPGLAGNPFARGIQYDDIRDAWNWYLQHDNGGRGFVLVGHSQGSFILQELIRREIDGKPIQERLVSAILPGATLAVAAGVLAGPSMACPSASRRARPDASLPTRPSVLHRAHHPIPCLARPSRRTCLRAARTRQLLPEERALSTPTSPPMAA